MFRALLCLLFLAFPAFAQPNIVLILADDFSMNLMPTPGDGISDNMPNLRRMMQDGMTLDTYIVSNSLCCPSRASIFTGMMPHNSGVTTNLPPDGGYFAFMAAGDEAKSFASVLQATGYQTGFMGKYLNGYSETMPVPPGWNEWAVPAAAYRGFGYAVNHNGTVSSPLDHFTDLISAWGKLWIRDMPAGQPFFLELATFSPHSPYVPPARYADAFPGIVMPKTPAYDARPDITAPAWLQAIPRLKVNAKAKLEEHYRLRVQASKGVDDMIGAIRSRIENSGLAGNTYVIFTSDNGFHLGEYSLKDGKKTPFDTDIHVPFVVVGPGIAPGSHNAALASNIDLYATFTDLAGAGASLTIDGRSMVPLWFGAASTRTIVAVEHRQEAYDPDDPDSSAPDEGDPPSYTALRLPSEMYVEYATGEVGYYDLATDPHELHNIAASLPPARLADLHAALLANATCVGSVECRAAQDMPIPSP